MHNPDRTELLRLIREEEATQAARYFPDGGRLLEVGAGMGLQAVFFQNMGFEVEAIDVAESPHIGHVVFPVQVYDGHHVPFPDDTFDVVFSSNVLEHVPWCEDLLAEMKRVLKDSGLMVHIVPTPTWRVWSSVVHYYWVIQLTLRLGKQPRSSQIGTEASPRSHRKRKSPLRLLRLAAFPFRHGAKGNWITEVYFFSRVRWKRTIRRARLHMLAIANTNLFYTGYGIPGPDTPMSTRIRLAGWLGSSTMILVLKKTG